MTLAARVAEFGALPVTESQVTWSGGIQYLFAFDAAIANGTDKAGESLDVKNTGGYIVVPPSVVGEVEDGVARSGVYAWRLFPGVQSAPPAWMRTDYSRRAAPSTATSSGDDWLTRIAAGSGDGSRGDDAARYCGYLWGKGMPRDLVALLMDQWNARCRPPMDDARLLATVDSICRRDGGPAPPPQSIGDIMAEYLDDILSPPKPGRFVATGIPALDRLLGGGFERGEYVLLGARPGMGKTALALQVSGALAATEYGALVFSSESSRRATLRRLLGQRSGVRSDSLWDQRYTDAELRMLAAAAAPLAASPLYFDFEAASLDAMRAAIGAYPPGALRLVVCDYLQNYSAGRDDRRQDVDALSRGLSRLAKEFDVTVLALSSLTRPDRAARDWQPTLASLKESSGLEHDGDLVVLLHRADGEDSWTDVNLAKSRDGRRPGRITLAFDPGALTFR
jgi:KaiC/GvpD/RAD55 family RecA-like ATPase